MNDTKTNETSAWEIQEFAPEVGRWIGISRFTGVGFATARDLWKGKDRYSDNYHRLIDLNAPEGRNVACGSISENPIQAAYDDYELDL